MNFGEALTLLKEGQRVKRAHWGGYWFMESPQCGVVDEEGYVKGWNLNPTIFAFLKDNGGFTIATPYQSDLLAEDWEEVK
jgi:hypothetical protein